MNHSWDDDSKMEYLEWKDSSTPTLTQRESCIQMLTTMAKEIVVHGTQLLIDFSRETVTLKDGSVAELYSSEGAGKTVMYFLDTGNHIRLVFIGVKDNPHNSHNIAVKRAKRWNP